MKKVMKQVMKQVITLLCLVMMLASMPAIALADTLITKPYYDEVKYTLESDVNLDHFKKLAFSSAEATLVAAVATHCSI